jgi:leucyl/phenylalanyl-tRNA--protein transferase
LLLHGYSMGVFPMSEGRHDPDIFWVDPRRRGILPLDGFHISRSLARGMRRTAHHVSINRDFAAVLDACADRPDTWINAEIRSLYLQLHQMGQAHSLEIWQDDTLVGGVYGVVLDAAFFGESMFSRRTDTSKMALAYLVDRLRAGGFQLFDTQFITPHLASLGAVEISRAAYRQRLHSALKNNGNFTVEVDQSDPQLVLQRITQTS